MTLGWAVVAIIAAFAVIVSVAASEVEKRLDRIVRLLERANEQRHENRTGEWRDR